MSLVLLGAIGLIVLLLVAAVYAIVRLATRGSGVRVSVDRALGWRSAGLVVGAVGAVVVIDHTSFGRGVLFAAPILGICVLGGTLVGELTAPAPTGVVRRAHLRVRRIRDYLSPVLSGVVAAGVVVIAVLSAVTTAAASPDGRGLACTPPPGGQWGDMASGGPWPGSFYTVPTLTIMLFGLVIAGLSLRAIVRRPQIGDDIAVDDARRRRSAEVVSAAAGILVMVPLLGFAVTAGARLVSMAEVCGLRWWSGAGWGLVGVGVVALLVGAWCLALITLPPARSRVAAAA